MERGESSLEEEEKGRSEREEKGWEKNGGMERERAV